MLVPDVLIALQIRNCAGVLEAVAKDGRMLDAVAGQLNAVAKSLRDAAHMLEHLPPFEPD